MPRINNYTPAWLSKPNPGHDIFTASESSISDGYGKSIDKPGPRRTIVHRGTEVFIAVGKEIRWADLVYLKEAWEDRELRKKAKNKYRKEKDNQYEEDKAQGYRTLKVPLAHDIRQLLISPNENYMAILTTHTVHIAILPKPSHLTAADTGVLKLKTYHLGPVTHVTTKSPVVSALWHPLGVNGSCLVTITEEAVVRVWEISPTDRKSFDCPALAIDLQKLADGTSVDQDFSASVAATNKGYSPDSVEMEVASACFAGRGSGGWSPMTLWIAMREGDVYALCPLLPSRWSPPPTLIPSLSISLVAKVAAMEDDPHISAEMKTLAQQQLAWMSDLDRQEPTYVEGITGEPSVEVYTRPDNPGRVPRLQGPFEFDLPPDSDELDSLLTDINVIGAKIDSEELMLGEEDELEMDNAEQEGLSLDVVCLLTSSGRLSVCLNLEGVEAQWLPRANRRKSSRLLEETSIPSLLTFQVLDTSRNSEVWEGSWPMFSPDFSSRYSFYITNTLSITFISLASWAFRLETEFKQGAAGTDLRIGLLVNGQSSLRERIHTEKMDDHSAPLAAANLLRDPDLGYFLLSATPYGPVALTIEAPDLELDFDRRSRSPTYDEPEKPLILWEPRPVYQPAHVLEQRSALPSFLEKLQHSKYKRLLKEEIRLSPATLTILTDAHKVLSEETHRINIAAAELFRRCERLQVELQTQIRKANDVANRVEAITGEDIDEGEAIGTEEAISTRMEMAQKRKKELTDRLEQVRRKVAKGTGRVLSEKEKAWIEEVQTLHRKVLGEGDGESREPWARYEEVMHLKEDLLDQVDDLASKSENLPSPGIQVPSEVRKQKVQQVISLLQRESQLVEGVKGRLERLSVS